MNVYGDEMFEKIAQSTVKLVVCQKGVLYICALGFASLNDYSCKLACICYCVYREGYVFGKLIVCDKHCPYFVDINVVCNNYFVGTDGPVS